MNAFSPIFRSHEGNQPSRDVQLCDDDELLAQLARFTQIHVGLTGYIKSLVKKQNDKGTPVMLPLFYYYDEDAAYTEKSEYLFGRDMLVAPILKEKATSRQVYLPRDRWIHLFTGQEYTGGKYTIDAPIGQPPVFVRADSDMYDEIMAAVAR